MNLICGINPVLEALSAGIRHFDRLLVVKGLRNRRISEAIGRAGQLGIPLRFEARETLDRMAGGLPHQGIMAVVSAKPVLELDRILDEARTPPLLLVLDGVEDPRNLGAILRTAEAAGVDGVLLPERHSAGLSETVSRASAGGLEHVKVARVGNVVQALESLKQRGYWVVGFDASGSERWDAVDYRGPVALVLGGEGRGVRRLVREHCDHVSSIPLFGHVASLNVSVAAGVALYEAIRQRGAVPSHVRPIPVRAAGAARHVLGPGSDDAEADPGLLAPPNAHPDGEGEDGFEPGPLVLMDESEHAAWAGPQMLKPVVRFGREHHGGPGRKRRDKGRSRAEKSGPRGEGREAGSQRGPSEAGGGERRRRRRRKRRGDAAQRTPPHEGSGAPPAPGGDGAPGAGNATRSPGGPARPRRRRRRRRP